MEHEDFKGEEYMPAYMTTQPPSQHPAAEDPVPTQQC